MRPSEAGADSSDKYTGNSTSIVEETALPVRRRSPSWPPMKIDLNEESKTVQRPNRIRKACIIAALVCLNNLLIFIVATVALVNYLGVETSTSFGPGLIVAGKLSADAVDVSIEKEQNAIFRSESADSTVSIEAADAMTAKIVLSKDSSTWSIANDGADQLVIGKGESPFFELTTAAIGGSTTTVSSHINTQDNTVYGNPLLMSTVGPLAEATTQLTDTDCQNTPANCVVAEDIVLSPGLEGRIRVNAPIAPVAGDLVIEPEERLRVQKISGSVASVMLENARLQLVNSAGTSCLQQAALQLTAVERRAAEQQCRGINTLRTLDTQIGDVGAEGELSISDAIFVNPQTKKVTFAGNFGIGDFPVEGTPLQLYGRAPASGATCVAVQSISCNPLLQGPCEADAANCVWNIESNCTAVHARGCAGLNETACSSSVECMFTAPKSQITLEALGGGKVVVNSPAHMIGPLVPLEMAGGIGRLSITGTLRVQNMQFQLMDIESERTDSAPTPSLTCNSAQPDRYGWLRLTRSTNTGTYHLFLCTESGWRDLIPPDAASGRRRRRLDVVGELDRMVELVEAGILTPDEFTQAKAELFGEAQGDIAASHVADNANSLVGGSSTA